MNLFPYIVVTLCAIAAGANCYDVWRWRHRFTRLVEFQPAFDRRHDDPRQNYGIHGVQIDFTLKGPDGAVSCSIFTKWHLPEVQAEQDEELLTRALYNACLFYNRGPRDRAPPITQLDLNTRFHPQPATLTYHGTWSRYPGHKSARCTYTRLNMCFPGVSYTGAEAIFDILLHEGDAGVWKTLEILYEEHISQ